MTRVVALLLACAICVIAFAGLTAAYDEVDMFDEEQIDLIQLQEQLTQAESIWATFFDQMDEHDQSLIQHETENVPTGAGGSGASAGGVGGTAGVRGGTAGVRGGTAGVRGGTAGVRGGTAGVRGGDAGGDGGTAGVRGGTAGVRGGTAGVRGGTAGVRGGTAGVRGGDAGNSSKVVVETTSDVHYPPFKGNFDPRDTATNQRVCRALRTLYIARYLGNRPELHQALNKLSGPSLLQASSTKDSFICSSASKDDKQVKEYPRVANFVDVYHKLLSLSGFNLRLKATTLQFVNKAATGRNNIKVEHQDSCGSCWAQAAIDSFEIALTKAGKSFSPRSVQQLVDCVYPNKEGCEGGSPMDALKYLTTHGSVDAASYPYTGIPGTCRTNPGGDLAALSQDRSKSPFSDGFDLASKTAKLAKDSKDNAGFVYTPCTETNGTCVKSQYMMEAELLIAIQETGPYVIYVDADNWQHYDKKTLVFPPEQCSSDPVHGNHLVQLLGFTLKNDIPVWIVKNSWGANFGDNGFIYLPIGYNACGLANFALRATVPNAASKTSAPLSKLKSLSSNLPFKMPKITRTRKGKKTKSTSKAKSAPAKKPAVAKKPVAKQSVAKKPVAKSAAAKKPVVKKSLLQRNATTKLKKSPAPKTKRKVVKRKVVKRKAIRK